MAVLSTLLKLSLTFLVATQVQGTPLLHSRASIASNLVVGFPQTVPSGITGTVYLAYQPHLDVVNGCVPFPAVDASGNTKYFHLPLPQLNILT